MVVGVEMRRLFVALWEEEGGELVRIEIYSVKGDLVNLRVRKKSMVLGLSNGYTTSLCMMQGPSLVPVTRASLAGNIMLFMLVGGLLGGSLFSFLWVAVAKA
jgi:hypothetical protein